MIINLKVSIIKMVKYMKVRIFIYLILISLLSLSIFRIIDICVINNIKYNELYNSVVNRTFKGMSAPRGRILDINGKVLVDNIGVNAIMYRKSNNISISDEIEISRTLSKYLDISNVSESKLKTFYLLTHNNGKELITDEEYKLLNERKLNSSDINVLKRSRITNENLDSMSESDKKASEIYYLLNKGYSYQNKIISTNVSDEVVAKVSNLNLKGIICTLIWKRKYMYDTALNSILGAVSNNSVPKEMKDYYLKKGLNLEASVGISGLEYQYDEYLRGTDAVYKLSQNNKVELLSEESIGADLHLSVDIDKQLKIEEILKKEILNARKHETARYFNHAYALVAHPKTGEIVAAAGLLYNKDHFIDITTNIINSSYTVGSIVKGASMSVGYDNNIIKKGKYVTDGCIKLYNTNSKCSWTRLGQINDISAMALSSNYYQFLIAIGLTGSKYKYNGKINATKEHFDIYRSMFASYGLGVKTGVDLPNEHIGIIGTKVSDDLLLNYAIGQYDTYTPIEVLQYVNTLANDGVRIAPKFMKKIVKDSVTILENDHKVLNEAKLSSENMSRVKKGLRQVMISGTGAYYADSKIKPSGKTGTSETFVDTDMDGVIDTRTISNAFIMYAPSNNPEYSIAIINPNITTGGYKYPINYQLNRKISKYLFENQ